jgi:isoleucyl-tRNA synthetase
MMSVYGSDIMRLWTASIDFTADARASEEIFKGNADMYRKVRNTFKFMLGNLHVGTSTFDSTLHRVDGFAWVDHLIIAKLNQVTRLYKDAMDRYAFGEATSVLTTFMSHDLSSFYLDITKDILYCEAATSPRRLQVLHVLNRLVHDLMIMLTPILPFTMEEVYQTLPQRDQLSCQLLTFPTIEEDCHDELGQLNALDTLREQTSKALELLRSQGLIGSSLEAQLTLTIPEPLWSSISTLPERERNRLFIVSHVNVQQGSTMRIDASRYDAQKCPRCWNYVRDLHPVDEHNVCDRCAMVINHA